MTGQMFIAALALLAIVAVLLWAVADHVRDEDVKEPAGPVLLDRSGRLIAPTEELPLFTPGRHRAGRWGR